MQKTGIFLHVGCGQKTKEQTPFQTLDWEEAEQGIYPKSLLFDAPWIEWFKKYPLVWLDMPSTWGRRKKMKTRDLPDDIVVNILIYDMLGKIVKTLVSGEQNSGYKSVQWDATNNSGQAVSAGVYIISIQAGEFRDTRKMLFVK